MGPPKFILLPFFSLTLIIVFDVYRYYKSVLCEEDLRLMIGD